MERSLTPTELMAMLGRPDWPFLLDVRRRAAFEADPQSLPGAAWRDPNDVDAWAAELPAGAQVVVWCVHGHEISNGVVDRLRELGFDAALVEGGIEAWRAAAADRPTQTSPGRDA